MQEGSVYEAVTFAGREGMEALTVILDSNGLQASDRVESMPSKVMWLPSGACTFGRW